MFDSGRVVQAPILLAVPLTGLTLLSTWAGGFTGIRLLALGLMIALTIACLLMSTARTRIELRPISQKIVADGAARELHRDATLELVSTDPTRPDSIRFPYEVRLRNGLEGELVLLRSSLANVLNDLNRLHHACSIPVTAASSMGLSLDQVIGERPRRNATFSSSCPPLSMPLRDSQIRIAFIFGAITCVAACVVAVLVTGQLGRSGPIGILGVALAASLIGAPALVGLHVLLGKTKVWFDEGKLRVEVTHGLLGRSSRTISGEELRGTWLVRSGDVARAEVLFFYDDSFCSIPLLGSPVDPWLSLLS